MTPNYSVSPSQTDSGGRLAFLDSLRGCAILLVIIAHCATLEPGIIGTFGYFFRSLGIGVQLFFVISGFTVSLTYSSLCSKGSGFPRYEFYIRRFMRIFPVYWFGMLLYTLVYGLESRGWLPGPAIWHFPVHFFLLNVWHPSTQSSVVPGGWSISVEVAYYLLFPFLFVVVRRFSWSLVFLLFTTIVLPYFVSLIRVMHWGVGSSDGGVLEDLWWSRSIFMQLGCFSFGSLAFKIYQKNCIGILLNKTVNLIVLLISALLLLFSLRKYGGTYWGVYLYSSAFFGICLCLMHVQWSLICNRFTIFCGRVSYSAYLLHFLVIKVVASFFVPESSLLYFFKLLALTLLVVLPLSWLLYITLEVWSIGWGRRLISSIRARALNVTVKESFGCKEISRCK